MSIIRGVSFFSDGEAIVVAMVRPRGKSEGAGNRAKRPAPRRSLVRWWHRQVSPTGLTLFGTFRLVGASAKPASLLFFAHPHRRAREQRYRRRTIVVLVQGNGHPTGDLVTGGF